MASGEFLEEQCNAIWQNCLNLIKSQTSDDEFVKWFKPMVPLSFDGENLRIRVPNQSHVQYIEQNYISMLRPIIREEFGLKTRLHYAIPNAAPASPQHAGNQAALYSQTDTSTIKNPFIIPGIKKVAFDSQLNPELTFENHIEGDCNRLARSAGISISVAPGKTSFNPLFIYGNSGLGKTHILKAICSEIEKNFPAMNVLYIRSEDFANEFISALTNKNVSDFHNKYRNNIDVILIDDIQFIIGKESTQEEFFHTFNHLHTSGKQIIISSDKPPKDIETLEARLRTRFEWGLIADISAPNYETRMAILQKKIELDQLEKYNIPKDVLKYIAENVKTNIRELEGSLNKLIALYKLNHEGEIDIPLAAEALKDIISSDNKREVTPELILDIVADHFGITVADLKSNKRNADIAFPRQIAMFLIRTMTESSLKAVGIILGGKDHSTVKYGIEKIASEEKKDETLNNTINIIRKKINPA